MRSFEDTLRMIGFTSIQTPRSKEWNEEANNYYSDWLRNCSDEEYERTYPGPKFVKFKSIIEIKGYEFDKLERLYG